MKALSMFMLFFISIIRMVNAQESAQSISFVPGLTVMVVTNETGTTTPLEKATVKMVMGKDTVLLDTDRNGRVLYNKRFATRTVEITVSCPGYKTVTASRTAPRPGQSAVRQVILKRDTSAGPN